MREPHSFSLQTHGSSRANAVLRSDGRDPRREHGEWHDWRVAEPIDPRVDIGHVHLKVADIKRALGFYRDVLGFEVTGQLGDQAAELVRAVPIRAGAR